MTERATDYKALDDQIRSEAYIADRPGQMDRLLSLADAVEALLAEDQRRVKQVQWLQKDIRGLRHRTENAEAKRDALQAKLNNTTPEREVAYRAWEAAVTASRYSYEDPDWWINPYRVEVTD